ncbi:MAG: DUF3380 domain-containing protein [Polaromonas sp.]|uniref:LysM peptidoglycan-binding domain-containing protein n=1 Tax=Polaromonas sp. TaxID=1869339 RepID=UPI0017A2201D|nr:N-acetylmuramidase domain-containing protein [Polaromonas sp.]NMM10649.1 DUF3380 domain-containing protein [Polaromonas sp.]
MSNTDTSLSDPYRVKHGDTLSAIAELSGHSVAELRRFNHLENPNQLAVGQTLFLSDASAFGVSVLFLDALRQPIVNLPYQLRFDGKVVKQTTGSAGLAPRQLTHNAQSVFEVWIQNAEQEWQRLTSTVSGCGHKMITLVSGSIVIKGQTQAHPHGAPIALVGVGNRPPLATNSSAFQPPLPKPAAGAASKNNKAVKTRKAKAPQGQSVIQIGVEIPRALLKYFANYKGGDITEADWNLAANGIDCDAAVLKAIAKVESGKRSSFWRLNKIDGAQIPAIMFERHYFSQLTGRKFDAQHPDISWPTGYQQQGKLGSDNKEMHDRKVVVSDIYSDFASSYLRLINAYQLDADAALKSCSWGKFQIMGANYATCGAADLNRFVATMCASELGQIKLLAGFIQRKPRPWKDRRNHALGKEVSLWDAVKTKNWQAIAFNYNGPGYKKYHYDTQIQHAYEQYSQPKA